MRRVPKHRVPKSRFEDIMADTDINEEAIRWFSRPAAFSAFEPEDHAVQLGSAKESAANLVGGRVKPCFGSVKRMITAGLSTQTAPNL